MLMMHSSFCRCLSETVEGSELGSYEECCSKPKAKAWGGYAAKGGCTICPAGEGESQEGAGISVPHGKRTFSSEGGERGRDSVHMRIRRSVSHNI
jgi:hypothetical protein